MLSLSKLLTTLLSLISLSSASPHSPLFPRTAVANPANNYSCSSLLHPNPVVLLHGLGATYYEDINALQSFLSGQGFCTFSLTYGSYAGSPYVGGLQHIASSALEIADLITKVHVSTGASKVDLVGHSEGAFQSLYVPKFTGVSGIVDKIVAIAPPTHGTSFANLYTIATTLGNISTTLVQTVISTFGCNACNDLVTDGAAVVKLNTGKIVQAGNTATIIISRDDELVTPVETAQVNEDGVRNVYIQDVCPGDPVGHIGEAYDTNTWNLVLNALENEPDKVFQCSVGSPGK